MINLSRKALMGIMCGKELINQYGVEELMINIGRRVLMAFLCGKGLIINAVGKS